MIIELPVINLIGYYIFTESSGPKKAGDKFIIQSPIFYADESFNFTFWQNRNGATIGPLEIFDNSTKIDTIIGNTGDVWLQGRVSISSGYHRVNIVIKL